MYDLAILHLSDLHVASKNNAKKMAKSQYLFQALCEDLRNQIVELEDESVIVAVTGDVIDTGSLYACNKDITDRLYAFFVDLKKVLGNKVAGIFFTPGNHDKARTDYEKLFLSAYRSMYAVHQVIQNNNGNVTEKFNNDFYNYQWDNHLESYKETHGTGYIEFTKRVYDLFDMEASIKDCSDKTYGVVFKSVLGKSFCFVLFNTAWSCYDDNDNRNLIFGDFQLDDIMRKYLDYRDIEKPLLTIAMGHHPLSMLGGKEEDSILEKMLSKEYLNTNVYLCGHTHDGSLANWNSNYHSCNTFVTGFGQSAGTLHEHYANYRYSLYVFHLDLNSIDVRVRKWDDKSFNSDLSFYSNSSNFGNDKIIFPIYAESCNGYLPLSIAGDASSKGVYISESLMNYMRFYVDAIIKWRTDLVFLANDSKTDVYEQINGAIPDGLLEEFRLAFFQDAVNNNPSKGREIKKVLSDNEKAVYNTFLGFLQEICKRLWECLLKDSSRSDSVVRFHFRFRDENENVYKKLCCYTLDEDAMLMSAMKYGELIEQSYKTMRGLIYSVNKRFTKTNLKNRWHNFITVVPIFTENMYKEYPYLTFGVTINSRDFDNMLYCMDYFAFNKLLGGILSDYVKQFQIDINSFCKWATETVELGKENT